MTIQNQDITGDKLAALISMAREGNKRVRIVGYKASDGSVRDLTVIPSDAGLYGRLLRDSKATLEKMLAAETGVLHKACEEQLASVNKSLENIGAGKPDSRVLRTGHENVGVDENEAGLVVLRHCESVESSVAEKAATKHRNELTAMKAALRKTLPTARYVAAYHLKPGKFDYVELI